MNEKQHRISKAYSQQEAFLAGLDAISKNNHATALNLLNTARNLGPPNPNILFNLGNLNLFQGEPELAILYYSEAANLTPNNPSIQNNLSTAYLRCKKFDQAEKAAKKATILKPDFAEAWNSLGNAQQAKKNIINAIQAFKKALGINSEFVAAKINLGHIYLQLNQPSKSLELFESACSNKGHQTEIYNGIALSYQELGDMKSAIKFFQQAIKSNPKHTNSIGNLANLHQKIGQNSKALFLFENAVSLNPFDAKLLLNYGHTLMNLGKNSEAQLIYEKAFLLNTDSKEPVPYLFHSKLHNCNWKNYKKYTKILVQEVNNTESGTYIPPFALANTNSDPSVRYKAAKKAAEFISSKYYIEKNNKIKIIKDSKKLNIGYVSPDFREHSLGETFALLLSAHNKNKFNFFGYTSQTNTDNITKSLIKDFHKYTNLSKTSLAKSVDTIKKDNIDILIDLAGHTRGNNLNIFAQEPAPIQAHYLGYGTTIGAKYISWLISDKIHSPPQLHKFCNESIVLLPNSFMPASANKKISRIEKSKRNSFNLPDDTIVFANFNSSYKFNPTSFKSWMNILKNCKDSVMWLQVSSNSAKKHLQEEALTHGISPKRLLFADRVNRTEHLQRLSLADIALDTFPHNGGVTTIDALLAGIPVINIIGENHSQRTGASILSAADLNELITNSIEDYESLAISLANDNKKLQTIKSKILYHSIKSSLFDIKSLSKSLETAYLKIYECWQRNHKPDHIEI